MGRREAMLAGLTLVVASCGANPTTGSDPATTFLPATTVFTGSFPTWYEGAMPDSYPWVSVARAAQLMGEPLQAATFLDGVHARYAPSFTLPTSCGAAVCGEWYDAEAGWFLLAENAGSERTRPARSHGRSH